MKHNASKTRETLVRILLVAAFAVTLSLTVGRQPFSPAKQAQAKTVIALEYNKYTHVKIGKTKRTEYYPTPAVTKVKSSDKSVLTAKINKKKNAVVVCGKKKGIAKVTVTFSNGMKDVIKYDVGGALTKETKNNKAKPKFNKKKAKKAFDIQNSYRADEGVDALEWSDELYEFAKYRLKTSGYDAHENLSRDTADYFGGFVTLYSISFGENLVQDYKAAQSACKVWKNSPGHYANMTRSSYQCGAIAYDSTNRYWVAVFSSKPASLYTDWQGQLENFATVTVKRYDSASGEYLNHARFLVYEKGNRSETQKVKSTGKGYCNPIEGEYPLVLEIGKTYVIADYAYFDGYNKANSVTLTVTGDCEVVLIG